MVRYSFSHVLFQEYLYKRLGPGERRLLHADVATAMETLYEEELDEIAVHLGHHFHQARDYDRALPYFISAAERAAHIYANDEAVIHYTRAIELTKNVSLDAHLLANLHHGRGLICATLGKFDSACTDFETALKLVHDSGERQLEWRLLLDLGKLWASRDYQMTRNYFESGLNLSRKMNDSALLAGSLNRMGNWYANDENPVRATAFHQEALKLFQELKDLQGQAITLDLLGIANLLGGNLNASVAYYNQAVAIFQELDNQPRLLSSLMGRGTTVSLLVLLATRPATSPPDALHDIQKAIHIAQETHAPTEAAWAHWTLGLLHIVQGQFGLALEVMESGLKIASEIGHGEWLVGNLFALGVLYCELLATEEARLQLEQALDRAQELRSQYWINHVSGALAKAYLLLDNPQKAQTCLENVLSSQTAMDTMGKRYCWTRRAELALFQNDPDLALDIVDRLIASAPSLPSHCVITFLWKLKGDALTMMGQVDEAEPLLLAALDNAQTQGERFLLWGAQASLGHLYRTMNRQNKAQQTVSTAHELIKELADTIQDKVLQDNFLQHAQARLSFP